LTSSSVADLYVAYSLVIKVYVYLYDATYAANSLSYTMCDGEMFFGVFTKCCRRVFASELQTASMRSKAVLTHLMLRSYLQLLT